MRCGAMWARKRSRGGDGMPSIITVGPCWRMSLASEGYRLSRTPGPIGAIWYHTILHRWMGLLRAAYHPRAARGRQAAHPENREQTYQSAHPHQASRTPHDVFLNWLRVL